MWLAIGTASMSAHGMQRAELRSVVTFLTAPADEPPSLPAVYVLAAAGEAERRAELKSFVAGILNVSPAVVTIEHRERRAPLLVAPAGSGLHLSSGSRDGVAALGVARTPIGVDVEVVTGAADIPCNVLHPKERAALLSLEPSKRNLAFLRLWTAKEAYFKALESGFERDPAAFAVIVGESGITVEDPTFAGEVEIVSRAVRISGREALVGVALVRLAARAG